MESSMMDASELRKKVVSKINAATLWRRQDTARKEQRQQTKDLKQIFRKANKILRDLPNRIAAHIKSSPHSSEFNVLKVEQSEFDGSVCTTEASFRFPRGEIDPTGYARGNPTQLKLANSNLLSLSTKIVFETLQSAGLKPRLEYRNIESNDTQQYSLYLFIPIEGICSCAASHPRIPSARDLVRFWYARLPG